MKKKDYLSNSNMIHIFNVIGIEFHPNINLHNMYSPCF